jgi:uncharacterized membrane protein YkvA (DUF1232 family)
MAGRSLLSSPWLLPTLVLQARLALRLLREPRVPMLTKAVLAGAAVYLISPLDFVPDLLPVLGRLDDLAMVLIAIRGFIRLCPPSAVTFHRTAIAQGRPFSMMTDGDDFIEAEGRRVG